LQENGMTRLALKDDQTTTGGRVMGGSSDSYAEDGRPFALDGDKATCGNCKGLWPILGSAHDWMDQGRSMVKDLDPVHCPCGKNRVFASGNSPFDYETGGSREPAHPITSTDIYDQQFRLRDVDGQPLANVQYRITTESGEIFTGTTDAAGKTQRIVTPQSSNLQLHADI
jgi:uncharacterized Zn-binding protein involved in type VI secretion